MQFTTKSRWLSRTFWVNLIGGLIEVVLVGQEVLGVLPEAEWRQGAIAALAIVLAVANVILRHLTSVPIQGTKAARKAAGLL